jgi:hypothetical protein
MGEEQKNDKEKVYCFWCCKCKNRHDFIVWINLLLAVTLIVYSFFSFINIFAWLSDTIFINILFPIYYA